MWGASVGEGSDTHVPVEVKSLTHELLVACDEMKGCDGAYLPPKIWDKMHGYVTISVAHLAVRNMCP